MSEDYMVRCVKPGHPIKKVELSAGRRQGKPFEATLTIYVEVKVENGMKKLERITQDITEEFLALAAKAAQPPHPHENTN